VNFEGAFKISHFHRNYLIC